MTNDIYFDDAVSLYDGGWRASDRDQLISEFSLSGDEADSICEWLSRFEADGAVGVMSDEDDDIC